MLPDEGLHLIRQTDRPPGTAVNNPADLGLHDAGGNLPGKLVHRDKIIQILTGSKRKGLFPLLRRRANLRKNGVVTQVVAVYVMRIKS